jgi:predicted transcriptional regulator
MRRPKEHPRRYVVSIRVSDEEMSDLKEMTRGSSMSISNLMREALVSYLPLLQDELTPGTRD